MSPKTHVTCGWRLHAKDLHEGVRRLEDERVRAWPKMSKTSNMRTSSILSLVGYRASTGLFAYMRIGCGANALKRHLRIAGALRSRGFCVPGDGRSVLVLA